MSSKMNLMHESREEMKRAEHMLYVSLKYTRTVDVIKNLIDRLISGITLTIDYLLIEAKEKKRIKEIPPQTGLKCEIVQTLYTDEKIKEMISFFLMLRKISKAEYKRSNEFRRHVTMTATTDTGTVEINLDVIKEYFEKSMEYLDYAENLINPKKD